jgi:spore coat protein U-like protein
MPASASTIGQKVSISAIVENSCTFTTIPSVGLVYDWRTGFSATTPAALTVQCNTGMPYYFTRDSNPNLASDSDGQAVLAYTLFVDDSVGAFDPQTNTGSRAETANGKTQNYAITINAAAGQQVPSGSYTCDVAFTLNY